MAFNAQLLHGGLETSHEKPLMNYRRFFAMHEAIVSRIDAPAGADWLAEIVTHFGPAIETPTVFLKLDGKRQQRLLEFARCLMDPYLWDSEGVGARVAYSLQPFSIDFNKTKFNRRAQKEVDCIRFQSEINQAVARGETAVALGVALTAIGMPATAMALYQNYDPVTARFVIIFARLFGSAYEAVANLDDNELDFSTTFRVSAARRFDQTFMDSAEVRSWLAESVFWHTNEDVAFNLLSQTGAGTDATDAVQAEMVELFSRLRRGDMDMKPWIPVAELVGHGFMPTLVVQLLGISNVVRVFDVAGDPIPGLIYITLVGAAVHPQKNTWQPNAATVEVTLKMWVPDGTAPTYVAFEWSIHEDFRLVLDNPVPDEADSLSIAASVSGGRRRWLVEAQSAVAWTPGEVVLGTFEFGVDVVTEGSPNPLELSAGAASASAKTADDEAEITFGGFTTVNGNTITVPETDGGPPTVLEAGVDFVNGAAAGSANALATAVAAAITSLSRTNSAAAVGPVVTVTNLGTKAVVGDITFVGAEIIADVGGASEAFTGFAATAISNGFRAAHLRTVTGLRLPSTKTLMFAQQDSKPHAV